MYDIDEETVKNCEFYENRNSFYNNRVYTLLLYSSVLYMLNGPHDCVWSFTFFNLYKKT